MANYEDIKPIGIRTSSDNTGKTTGQVWYNSTEEKIKYKTGTSKRVFVSGGDLNTARWSGAAAGTNTAGLLAGGLVQSFPAVKVGNAEVYDGTSWTEVSDLNTTANFNTGIGTSTAALSVGGAPGVALNESWNGSSWTEVADLNAVRQGHSSSNSGTTTAGIIFGGQSPPASPDYVGLTESWNGSSWTEVGDLNTVRSFLGGCGTQTASLAFGGLFNPPIAHYTNTESWNGSSWTEVNDLPTNRAYLGGAGSSTDAIAMGGLIFPGAPTNAGSITDGVEHFDGTSWSESNPMNRARYRGNSAGAASSSSFIAGGFGLGFAATEECVVSDTISAESKLST